jgi:tripartite-type tricarboxylate transporter receptor subunit TctC
MHRLFFILLFLVSTTVHAFEPKDKNITIVTGFAPGVTDRVLQPFIDELTIKGYVVITERKPGVGGMIALNHFVNHAPADGYTLFATASSMFTISPILTPELVPSKNLELISTLAAGPIVLVSSKSSKIKTFDDFKQAVLSNTEPVVAVPTPFFQASAEYIAWKISNTEKISVAMYKSGPDVLRDLLGGHVEIAILQLSAIGSYIDGNKINILASSGENRLLKDVPTFSEKLNKFNPKLEASWGIALPKGTPEDIKKFYSDFFLKVAQQESTKNKFAQEYLIIPKNYLGKEAFEFRLKEESEMWALILQRISK